MNTRELCRRIAYRLPHRTQADVDDVLHAFVEVTREELMHPNGSVYLQGFGRLHVDRHGLRPAGVFRNRYRPQVTLRRLYFRFTPTDDLKAAVRDALDQAGG
ncbi:MAG: HU family DNA-binding protein [Aggregatilineales bacterium]